ncbi:MAG: hypothetical protein WCJ75_17250, partial [Desulfomonile sp.]
PRTLYLNRWPGACYAQKQENNGFFTNVMKVLPPSAHVGDMRGPFRGQMDHPATGNCPKDTRNGKTAT